MKRLSKNLKSAQVDMVILEGGVTIGASGSLTGANLHGAGIERVTQGVNPGKYSIVLEETYNKFFSFTPTFVGTTNSTIGSVQVLSEAVQSTGTINIQCYDITGTAASPAAGVEMKFVVIVRESGVQGKGE